MTNKVINSIDDLDDLDLDLEDTNISSVDDELDLEDVSENKEDTSIDDLELEDVVPDEKPEDDLKVEAERKDPLDEEIEFDLELEVNEQPKAEVKQVETKTETKTTPTVEPKEEPKKRGRKPKLETQESDIPVVPVPENKTEVYLDNAFDLSKINDKHYRFLVKPLNLHNYDKMIEDCIRINGNMINPIQLVIEEGEFRLISGFNTFDVLKKLDVKTTWAIIFPKMTTYQVVKRYITATHHLD